MTPASFVSSLAVLFSMSAIPWLRIVSEKFQERENAQTYLKVGSKLFHNSLPGNETFDEDICRFEVLKSDIFFDKRLVTGQSRISGTGACSGRRARMICVTVQIHDDGWLDGARNSEIVLYLP